MLLLLLASSALAARPDFCRADLESLSIPWREGVGTPSREEAMRALRPSLLRIQEDICRCIRKPQHWPEAVQAEVEVTPPTSACTASGQCWGLQAEVEVTPPMGIAVVRYRVAAELGAAGEELHACMGQPTVTFEAFAYRSDALTGDDRETRFRYPFKVELEPHPRRRHRD